MLGCHKPKTRRLIWPKDGPGAGTLFKPVLLVFLVGMSLVTGLYLGVSQTQAQNMADYTSVPTFITAARPPLLMMVMGRNHKLYYEAYNDASDLNGDGSLDVGYNPNLIDENGEPLIYYGYFDSNKCYEYDAGQTRFEPVDWAVNRKCDGANEWSGDFLNYLTMCRMDTLRKVLYGGYRSTDTAAETVLERAFIPQDAHSWGKEYFSIEHDGYDIRDYTPLDLPQGASRHLFVNTTLSVGGNTLLRVLENTVFRVWEWVAIERPVAGSEAVDSAGRRSVTDNNVGVVGLVDVTAAGTAGTITHYGAGLGGTTTITDDFQDGIVAPIWSWVDNDQDPGTAYLEVGGEMVIDAAGIDIWTGADQFGSVYLNDVDGNFDFILKVHAQERQNGWGKAGIMVRNEMTTPGASSGYVIMAVTPDNGYSFQWDSDSNGYLDNHVSNTWVTLPAWVRLKKEGTTFTGYRSADGINWTQHHSITLGSANGVQDVGLFVTSHTDGVLSQCEFEEMSVTITGQAVDPSMAFDDSNVTKWVITDEPTAADPVWIQFAFDDPKRIQKYKLTTASDLEGRDPKTWKLLATNDDAAAADTATNMALWTVVDTIENGSLPAARTTEKEFICDNAPLEGETYKYYRLLITASKDAGVAGIQIAEIEMFEELSVIPANGTLTDYTVRVQVCVPGLLEDNSKLYGGAVYKPIGLLQRHGESDSMYFGLITGSYTKNTSGGVLRKNISSIRDEINPNTGEFLYQDDASVQGIIKTIDKLKVVGFDYGSFSYNQNCGWITTSPISEGKCRMWGNPIAEMMYEGMRYFAGKASPTAAYTYPTGANDDTNLGLPKPNWLDPYTNAEDKDGDGVLDPGEDLNANGVLDGFGYCAKPFMLVLSDINPTFDSNQLPGSDFNAFAGDLAGLDVEVLGNQISATEIASGLFTAGEHFIGQQGTNYDGACTAKNVTGFGDVRGLCPEEPTKQGSYYSAAVAYYGHKTDLHSVTGDQKVTTYTVGLASPLPRIEIPVAGKIITLVPFAKSTNGSSINPARGQFQPTNTIVDFFVDTIEPARGVFRINYEDVEQGADHDMDAHRELSLPGRG